MMRVYREVLLTCERDQIITLAMNEKWDTVDPFSKASSLINCII
jgi:hypothetical protein